MTGIHQIAPSITSRFAYTPLRRKLPLSCTHIDTAPHAKFKIWTRVCSSSNEPMRRNASRRTTVLVYLKLSWVQTYVFPAHAHYKYIRIKETINLREFPIPVSL